MTKLLRYLILPRDVTAFEARYLRRMNKIALVFFWAHPPAFVVVALLAGTSVVTASALSLAAMVGPTLAYVALADRPRMVSMVYGFTAMLMGGALVYIGQGPMQIEMHFYFFVLLALLAVFANPLVILTAAGTVAVHHFLIFLILPRAVFNYDASIWAVVVHAIFVVLESVAACFVARSFFDNVIGLETIVQNRTRALDSRNVDMARILDNVAQGFVTIDLEGKIGGEWSSALVRWFGAPVPGGAITAYLCGHDPELQAWMQLGFDGLAEGFMPFDLVVDQLPSRITREGCELRVEYQAIGAPPTALLVMVTDITSEVARQRAEAVQRELIAVVERAFRDRAGFCAFLAEASELVKQCVTPQDEPLAELKRRLHTLKGNSAMFCVTSIAAICHDLEEWIDAQGVPPEPSMRTGLGDRWREFNDRISGILGIGTSRVLQVDWNDYQTVVASLSFENEPAWATKIKSWDKPPVRPRLEHYAEYAQSLAARLGKTIQVTIEDHGLRIERELFAAVWSALVHSIRNSVDHGIEAPAVRIAAGKSPHGNLQFETVMRGDELHVVLSDDGGGIDWKAVAAKAAALGLPTATRRDLEEALFASGMSTAENVTETSGRGVGMDALRAGCIEVGGHVSVESSPAGTRITCVLPFRRARRAPRLSSRQIVRVSP